jgi:hypothetical protein
MKYECDDAEWKRRMWKVSSPRPMVSAAVI